MALTDVYKDVITIVNEVERKLGINESTRIDQTKTTKLLVDFLNDTIDECNDYGDWPQMYRTSTVSASASVESYEIAVSAQIKNVFDVYFDTDKTPLIAVGVAEIRRLQKTRSFGKPRFFCMVDVSGVNMNMRTSPIPVSAQQGLLFDLAYYKKNRIYSAVTADSTAVPLFPAKVLIHGVYVKAMLEESGQQRTAEVQSAEQDYKRARQEALNRMQADTAKDVTFYVGRR